ncbi:MAG: hypothetical protein ACXWZK_12335, partial [Solirubrobacterales bacterium]
TGRLWIAWASNSDAPGKLGVFGQIVDSATGAPTGTPQVMPGTVINSEATGGNDKFDASLYRTPVAERVGGGVFVAYHGGTPQRTGVVVWRTGAPQSTLLTSAKADYVAVAAAPDGRIWVVWTAVSKGRTRVIARRSNKDGGSFGAPVSTTLPKGTDAIYNQSASSQEDLLDVVYHFDNESNSVGIADWHTQLLPGLTVKASKSKLVAGKKTKVTFKVTDAGDPVAGAKVKVGAKSGKTNKAGKVTLTLPAFKKGKKPGVVYTIAGYAKASSTLRVVRR